MQSRTKKLIPSEGTNGSEDRLSEMPDHLIVHILSFMPTLHAVKTMLLRRFGNLWTLVPTLTFDLEEYDQVIWPEEEDETIHEVFSSFARFIRKVLMLHKRHTIDSFHLSMKPFDVEFKDPKLIDDVQMWLRFAIDRQVKDLNLSFNGYDDLVLPHSIFMSQSLITLTLHGCMLEHQPNVHMGTLRELSLVNVKGSGQVFNQLILGCPSLRELNINISNLSHVLNITSPSVSKLCLEIYHPDLCITLSCPNMKNLDILVCGIIQSFMVDAIDVSSLQKMNVKGLPTGSLSLFKTFLRQFRNVEVVTWSCHALEWATVNQLDFHSTKLNKKACHSIVYQPRKLWLSCACLSCAVGAITGGTQHKSQCSTLKTLSWGRKIKFPRTKWKRLVLRPLWDDNRCVQVILELLKSSVKLEELILHNYFSHDDQGYGCIESSTTSTYVMPLLKKVTIHRYGRFSKAQLQVVEIVLQNAILLEQLVIHGNRNLTAVNELNFVKQVSKFRRASANATVIFD